MFSTCLHCTKDLGKNEIVETLPIGRRLAFDAAQGRLWVVCRHCAKWNLVPFDTRLESIDACERLYRDTRTRYATDNIGLARVKEGLELVRIGEPLRPEFASWRYADHLRERRRKAILTGTPFAVLGAGVSLLAQASVYMSAAPAIGALVAFGVGVQGASIASQLRHVRSGLRLPSPDGTSVIKVSNLGLQSSAVRKRHGEFELLLGWDTKRREAYAFRGPLAEQVLPRVLAGVNQLVGSRRVVGDAINRVPDLLRTGSDRPLLETMLEHRIPGTRRSNFTLAEVQPDLAVAWEILGNEAKEREWLAGEMKLLEREWREAERIAKISDDLQLDGEQRTANGEER